MTAPGAGLPSKAPTTGQPSGPRPAGPPEWLSSSHVRTLHSCIVYDARDRNHPAISSGVTSCKAEANAAQTAYRRRRPSIQVLAVLSSRAAIASQVESGETSSGSTWQTEVGPVPTAPSHPSANHDRRFAAILTLAWRDGSSPFRACFARRSHRPTHPGGIFAAPCASVRLSPSTRERLSLTLDYPDSLIHQYRIPAPAADKCRRAPALPSWCPLAPASVAAQTAPGSRETRAWRTWRTLSPRTHAPAHTHRDSPPVPP